MEGLPKLKLVTEKKKPKILLLSDDLTTFSGIATMSKTFVLGTVDQFDWVQIASAAQHPFHGQVRDASEDVKRITGVQDASVKLYCTTGYGDQQKLREIYYNEKPDAILHFTDPRFWEWLYQMEDEIHSEWNIPIMYYAIWDDLPYPLWNKGAYSSCDLIMGISKQSHLIHQKVLEYAGVKTHDLDKNQNPDWKPGEVLVRYVPHGIDEKVYFPITKSMPEYLEYNEYLNDFKKKHEAEFIFYWSNRNIRRKAPADLIYAYELFCKKIGDENAKKTLLLMHTDVADINGTDLEAVRLAIAPTRKIIFSTNKLDAKILNFNYNMADTTINIADNEGFGLSSAESLMTGTPVINNVTGGLQDQCRFEDNDGNWFIPTNKITSNHAGTFKKCGEWAFPVFPSNRSIQGSIPTPYIFADRVNSIDVARQMVAAFEVGKVELKRRGRLGHQWVMGDESKMSGSQMSKSIGESIQYCIDNFPGYDRIDFIKFEGWPTNFPMGIVHDKF